MRRIVTVGILLSLATLSASGGAAHSETKWMFRSVIGDYKVLYKPMEPATVVMRGGSTWTCTKDPVGLGANNTIFGAFICSSKLTNQTASFHAVCATDKPDSTYSGGCIGDATGITCFTVSCDTTVGPGTGI